MKLDESVAAIVTGGASGLGEASARMLAAEGARVAIFDMNAERGEAVAREIGGVFCSVDVTSDDGVRAGFEQARGAHGQERILVNCAGIAAGQKTVGRDKATVEFKVHDLATFERVIRINLIGSFRCAAFAVSGMAMHVPVY